MRSKSFCNKNSTAPKFNGISMGSYRFAFARTSQNSVETFSLYLFLWYFAKRQFTETLFLSPNWDHAAVNIRFFFFFICVESGCGITSYVEQQISDCKCECIDVVVYLKLFIILLADRMRLIWIEICFAYIVCLLPPAFRFTHIICSGFRCDKYSLLLWRNARRDLYKHSGTA